MNYLRTGLGIFVHLVYSCVVIVYPARRASTLFDDGSCNDTDSELYSSRIAEIYCSCVGEVSLLYRRSPVSPSVF